MYIPQFFKNENTEEIRAFIEANNFGILVSGSGHSLAATHIPFIISVNDKNETVLSGHISRANKQLDQISPEEDVLVIFQGPHSYISSSWYDHENVPT
jgi:transcriptional regulator